METDRLDNHSIRAPLGNRSSVRRHRRGAGNPVAIAKAKAEADRHALQVLPIIIKIRSTGKTSLSEIATELNNRGISSARQRQWYAMSVRNLLARVCHLLDH